jgi:hypothetical protein
MPQATLSIQTESERDQPLRGDELMTVEWVSAGIF